MEMMLILPNPSALMIQNFMKEYVDKKSKENRSASNFRVNTLKNTLFFGNNNQTNHALFDEIKLNSFVFLNNLKLKFLINFID
jgi:hypothetical protein